MTPLSMPIFVTILYFSLVKSSMSETQFDSEVMQLVQDLGLVLKGSLEHLYFLALVAESQYARYHFCDRIKDKAARMERERNIRLSMLYRECRPYSHVKPHNDSFVCAPTLFK